MPANQHIWYNAKVQEIFSKEEIKALLKKSDARAAWEIIETWLWIVGAFLLAGFLPNVITVSLALWVLGGKQLACAIILHDAAHHSLFTTKRLNVWIGNLFGAWPVFHNIRQYQPYHLEHHKTTGTDDDPDIVLTRGYPTTRKSMFRKFFRDLSGITGIKAMAGLMAMHLGILEYNLGNKIVRNKNITAGRMFRNAWKNLRGPVCANLGMAGICYMAGMPWLYFLWPAANIFTYPFCLRIRSMAEHSMVPDRLDPQQNSRTVKANFIGKIFFAPLHVNYHAEHHLHMAVPSYRFPKMHKMLMQRGYYEKALLAGSYREIIRMAIKTLP